MVRHALICLFGLSLGMSLVRVCGACPSCPSALTVREQVFGQDFEKNLLISLVPFLLVGWIARRFEFHTGRDKR